MKILTFEVGGEERVGLLIDGKVADVNSGYALFLKEVEGEYRPTEISNVRLPSDMIEILKGGESSMKALKETSDYLGKLLEEDPVAPDQRRVFYSFEEIRFKAPVPRPPKLLELLHAYKGMTTVFRRPPPKEVIFRPKGYQHTVNSHGGPIVIPKEFLSNKVMTQIELGIVIGREAHRISEERAYDYVAGYTVFNDVNVIDVAAREGYMVSFKPDSYPTFGPFGPWFVPKEQIPDPQNLDVTVRINGRTVQEYNTKDMLFTIKHVIAYISEGLPLEPGDVISCGAAEGVQERCIIKPGDTVEGEIEHIGMLRNPVTSE
ncbi:MAG: hypothetical protein GTN80_04090 [Nitrososphaeria archaeon]|nr:hypothetical protein [Nitrososphaeria archaeon]NIN52332.1 hypothetical protein [Nitrososphaeria archaeon]NIQ32810.1 hypothetical protein [Nitrososphaeria archaeon]